MIDLSGRAAIVTGGASGIGQGISMVLATQGADVAVADLNGPGAEAVAEQVKRLGRKSLAYEVDVRRSDSVASMVSGVLSAFGKVDILVNDAGAG